MEPQAYYYFNPWIMALIAGLLLIVPTWRVFRRAGLHPAWSLLVLLGFPVGVLLVLAVLALKPWPADRELAR
jgi:hypothetical protein